VRRGDGVARGRNSRIPTCEQEPEARDCALLHGCGMKIRFAVVIVLALVAPRCLAAAQAVTIDGSFTRSVIGKNIEFLEDRGKKLTIDDAVASDSWKASPAESFNFGFTPSVYWFSASRWTTPPAATSIIFSS